MRGFDYKRFKKKDTPPDPVRDTILAILQWLGVTVFLWVWWTFLFLMLSIILLNVWHVTLKQIMLYSTAITAVMSIGYAVSLYRKGIRK